MSNEPLSTMPESSQTLADKDTPEVKDEPTPAPVSPDFPDGGLRAWGVALGNAGVMLCTLGYVNSWGVYQAYYQTHQLSTSTPSSISWIGSLQTFFIFSSSLLGGPLFDRYGSRTLYAPALLFVFTIFMTSLCSHYWHFMLAQGVLGGISMGLIMAPAMAATPQYFRKKRGAAMGVGVAGASVGGVLHPIALNRMLTSTGIGLGFGWAVRIEGFLMLAVLAVSCPLIRARLPPRKSQFLLPQAFREAGYTTLIVGSPFTFMGMFPPLFYLPSYGISQGMDPSRAFYLVAILNATSLPGRIIPAMLSDTLGKLNAFAFAGITTGILTLCWIFIRTETAIIIFTALFGFCSGAIISGGTVALANCARSPKDIGTYMGMGMAWISIAPLIAPPISGALSSTWGFGAVALFAGAVTLLGGVWVLVVVKRLSGCGVWSRA